MNHNRSIAVIGLGYVGLPVATSFAKSGVDVVGFDIDDSRIRALHGGLDKTGEVEPSDLCQPRLHFTSDPDALAKSDFYIVTVPTPIDSDYRPDLKALKRASEIVGRVLSRGDIVVYESTVYPGVTENECLPILSQTSGLEGGTDFTVGYSPERINPGDRTHRFETIEKVVSGQDQRTLDIVAEVYESVVVAGVYRAASIQVAEAAKVIENTQRDLNIAFMNELSEIFDRIGIDTGEVLAAARTKWNFLPFTPGLVGGHCIGIDPYYLTYRAEAAGYHPKIILAGRQINNAVGSRVAQKCMELMRSHGSSGKVTVLGLTFKENVPDIRNSKVADIIRELRSSGLSIQIHDPLAMADDARREYGLTMTPESELSTSDAVILAVPHKQYVTGGWPFITSLLDGGRGVVIDVKGHLNAGEVPAGITLWRL